GLAAYAAVSWFADARRRKAGLEVEPVLLWGMKMVGLAVLVLAFVAYLSIERSPNPTLKSIKGVPLIVAIIVGLLVVLTYVLDRTAWDVALLLAGGNASA